MERNVARKLWQATEPVHAVTYFAPESRAAFAAAGLRGFWMGYFGGRAAPMGRPTAEVVVAAFFNFHPAMVRRAIPDAWALAEPARLLAARLEGVDVALRRLLGADATGPAVAEAAELAQVAALAGDPAGRPLYAANAALPWPDEPHLVLWQATTLLREFRGDGHVASLLVEGLDGCEAHVLLAGGGGVPADTLRENRGWSQREWGDAVERLRGRGWLDGGGELSGAGRAVRDAVEARTDCLALPAWRRLGARGCDRLHDLLVPLVRRVVGGGGLPYPNPIGVPPVAS